MSKRMFGWVLWVVWKRWRVGEKKRFGKIPRKAKSRVKCLSPVEDMSWQKGGKNNPRMGK